MPTSMDNSFIQRKLREFTETSELNRLLPAQGSLRIYEPPLVGFASASDEMFATFIQPEIIGPNYMPPLEWLTGACSVVSYFLPFTKEVRDSNRAMEMPSLEWVSARIEGEAFNKALMKFAVDLVLESGGQAVAPSCDPRFKMEHVKSNWSERHAAHVAGLGTFGLHKGLITAKGTAGRFGSIVTNLEFTPDPRPYTNHEQYCLYIMKGTCGVCIKRCHVNSITDKGKDKDICADFIANVNIPMFSTPGNFRYGCGKCNISVPCESRNPLPV